MFGFGPLISLAIYAGIAAVALGAIYGFDKSRQNVGRDKQIAEDQPVMMLCEQYPAGGLFSRGKGAEPVECARRLQEDIGRGKAAEDANRSLQADLAKLDEQRKACSGAVSRLERQGAAAAKAAGDRKPTDDKALAAISAEKQALIDALDRADSKAGTCEQRLARRDALWAGIAAQRQRDFPPGSVPEQSGDVNIRPSRPTNPLLPK